MTLAVIIITGKAFSQILAVSGEKSPFLCESIIIPEPVDRHLWDLTSGRSRTVHSEGRDVSKHVLFQHVNHSGNHSCMAPPNSSAKKNCSLFQSVFSTIDLLISL